MATKREKRATLEQWAEAFPCHTPWEDKFLLRRNGPLISGICLDDMRDGKTYRPTYFFHNLIVDWPVLTLGYGASLRQRGVAKAVRYQSRNDEPVGLKDQVESARLPASFALFVKHLADARRGAFGPMAVYLPHALRDVMSVGSCLGDAAFFRERIAAGAGLIASASSINLQLIGSVDQWTRDVGSLLASDLEERVQQNLLKLGLPSLANESLPYARPDAFPACF